MPLWIAPSACAASWMTVSLYLPTQRFDFPQVYRQTGNMNRHNRSGPLGDSRGYLVEINIEGVALGVHKDNLGAGLDNGLSSRDESV